MAIVAIVGRKNVGKSSIFNRLLGMRMNIVHQEPGITRDRVYGEVSWRGRVFHAVDTGGFFPQEDIALARKIMGQIERALAEADVIYLVVDGKAGLVPMDEEIAAHIRRVRKPVFLVINKIDNARDEIRVHEFDRLGFSAQFPVSAEAGKGFGELLDATLPRLPAMVREAPRKHMRLMIVGRPNAGKSTLLNALVADERAIVDDQPGTTRDMVAASIAYQGRTMEIIDTAGIRRRARIKEPVEFYSMMRTINAIERVDVVVLIFDATQGVVAEDCRLAALILSKAKAFVIAMNKMDLIAGRDRARARRSAARSFSFVTFAPIVPISAARRTNLDQLLSAAQQAYSEYHKTADKNVLRSIGAQLRPPPAGQVVKLHQAGTAPPRFVLTTTTSVREDYIKYTRNMIRNYFGYLGSPILIRTRKVSP